MRNDQSHKIKLLKVHNATYATLLKIEVRSTSQRLQPYHSKKLAFDLNIGLDIHCRRFTVRSARIWTRNSVWIRWVIVMMVQLKSDRMTSSKWVWVQKMCEWSGISSQEIFKKKHKQQQFFSIEKNLTDFQSTCCPRKGAYISMIWHAGLVNVLTRSCAMLIEKQHTTRLLLKGRDKTENVFLMLSGHTVDRQNPATVFVSLLFAGLHIFWPSTVAWDVLATAYITLFTSISYSKEAGISHISHSLGVSWASLLPSQQCTRRAKEMQFANAIVSTTFFQPESSSNQLRTTGNTPTAAFLPVCMTWVAEDSGCAKPNSNDFSSRASMVFTWFCFSQNLEAKETSHRMWTSFQVHCEDAMHLHHRPWGWGFCFSRDFFNAWTKIRIQKGRIEVHENPLWKFKELIHAATTRFTMLHGFAFCIHIL